VQIHVFASIQALIGKHLREWLFLLSEAQLTDRMMVYPLAPRDDSVPQE
jgi:hypothetical protein